jgi:AcrR family transcriptional regulator
MDAAEQMLLDRPLRDLAVDDLMAVTTLRRPSFYVYFKDRGELMLALLDRLQDKILGAGRPWFELPVDSTREEAVEALAASLHEVTEVFAEHGALILGVSEAAVMDEKVEAMYRGVTIQAIMDAVERRLVAERRAGRSTVSSPQETAAALVLLNEGYWSERLGREPRQSPAKVSRVVRDIWVATVYGTPPVAS